MAMLWHDSKSNSTKSYVSDYTIHCHQVKLKKKQTRYYRFINFKDDKSLEDDKIFDQKYLNSQWKLLAFTLLYWVQGTKAIEHVMVELSFIEVTVSFTYTHCAFNNIFVSLFFRVYEQYPFGVRSS